MAHTGTLFLDEISEMNLGLQSKLLRVLQEREVDRIGGREPVPVNIRVIATTNRSLYHEVTQGRFREDLFYRLNVFPVTVPPLRDRSGDIPLLARHFLRSSAQRNGLTMPTLSERAIADLQQRPWKGNVRELENVMERAILVATGGAVDVDHLMPGDGTVPVREVEAGRYAIVTALRTWVAMGDGAGSYFQDPGARERKPHACGEGIGDQYQKRCGINCGSIATWGTRSRPRSPNRRLQGDGQIILRGGHFCRVPTRKRRTTKRTRSRIR
jgi:DNA-binding NtrC family response regulator